MIDLLFKKGNEYWLIRIMGNDVQIGRTSYGSQLGSIYGLARDKKSVIKEFPELANDEEWRSKAISIMIKKINSYNREEEKARFLIDDLKKDDYQIMKIHKQGFRETKKI